MLSWVEHVKKKRFITSGPNKWGFVLGSITKTRLYNIEPIKPHFYIVKLGFTAVYIIFLTS